KGGGIIAVFRIDDRQWCVSAAKAHVERPLDFDWRRSSGLSQNVITGLLFQSIKNAAYSGWIIAENAIHAGRAVLYDVSQADAQSTQNTSVRMNEDLRDSQIASDGASMLRPSSPEGDEHVIARIVAFGDRDRVD